MTGKTQAWRQEWRLKLENVSQAGEIKVEMDGEEPWTFTLPWNDLDEMQEELYHCRVLSHRAFSQEQGGSLPKPYPPSQMGERCNLQKMGKQLFSTLFPKTMASRFEEALARAQEEGALLRLVLVYGEPEGLAWAIPWELLYARWADERLGMVLRHLSIVRYVETEKGEESVLRRWPRVAFFFASPKENAVPTDATRAAIMRSWGEKDVLMAGGERWEDWTRLLEAYRRLDILHFLGHGEGERLLFVREGNEADERDEQALVESLEGSSVRLLILQACKSSGLAARLVQAGALPELTAAVGMHDTIGTDVADAFAEGLHSVLSRKEEGDLEWAVAAARIRMWKGDPSSNGWLLPVLVMGVRRWRLELPVRSFRDVKRPLPQVEGGVERQPILGVVKDRLEHSRRVVLAGGGRDAGRTWLSLMALQAVGIGRERTWLFDLRRRGNIYDLWYAVLEALERGEGERLRSPLWSEEDWSVLQGALQEALAEKEAALLVKMPSALAESDVRGWRALLESFEEGGKGRLLLLFEEEPGEGWRALVGDEVVQVPPWQPEEIIQLVKMRTGAELTEEEAREVLRMGQGDLREVLRVLGSVHSREDVERVMRRLKASGSLFEAGWERLSEVQRRMLEVIAALPEGVAVKADDLLGLLEEPAEREQIAAELEGLERSYWLQFVEEGYVLSGVRLRRDIHKYTGSAGTRQRIRDIWKRQREIRDRRQRMEMLLDEESWEAAVDEILSDGWRPWELSASGRRDVLGYIEVLWERLRDDDGRRFALARRAARAARALGDYRGAAEWYRKGEELAPDERSELEMALERLFIEHRLGEEPEEADEIFEEIKAVGDGAFTALGAFTLALIYAERGERQRAVAYVEEGLRALLPSGEVVIGERGVSKAKRALRRLVRKYAEYRHLIAQAMRAYGVAHLYDGRFEEAEAAFALGAKFFAESGDRYLEAITYNNLGAALLRQGKLEKAKEAFARAEEILKEVGDPAFGRLVTLFNGALRREFEGASYPEEIVPAMRGAAEMVEENGYLSVKPYVYYEYGKALAMIGEWDEGMAKVKEGRMSAEKMGDRVQGLWGAFHKREIALYRWMSGGSAVPPDVEVVEGWLEDEGTEAYGLLQEHEEIQAALRVLVGLVAAREGKIEEAQRWIEGVPEEELAQDPALQLKRIEVEVVMAGLQGTDEARRRMKESFKVAETLEMQSVYHTQLRYHYAEALVRFGEEARAKEEAGRVMEEAQQMGIPWLEAMAQRLLEGEQR